MNGSLLPLEEQPASLALQGETVVQREVRVRRVDTGQEVITSVNCMPVRDASGEVVMAVVTVEDITANPGKKRGPKRASIQAHAFAAFRIRSKSEAASVRFLESPCLEHADRLPRMRKSAVAVSSLYFHRSDSAKQSTEQNHVRSCRTNGTRIKVAPPKLCSELCSIAADSATEGPIIPAVTN